MHEPLKERLNPKHNCHQDIRGLEAVYVGKEVSSKFPILVVVTRIAADSDEDEDEHEDDAEHFHEGGRRVEAEHHIKGSEPKEGEIFKVTLEE